MDHRLRLIRREAEKTGNWVSYVGELERFAGIGGDPELATIPLSFVLGLGVATILISLSAAIRDRREHALHWMPIAWAVAIFMLHIQYWFFIYDLDDAISAWNWLWYGQMLLQAVLLFMAGALIFPTRSARVTGGLIKDFDVHGRLALVGVAAYMLVTMITNARVNDSFFILANLVNALLAALAMLTYLNRRQSIRAGATVVFSVLLLYAFAFLYALPGPS